MVGCQCHVKHIKPNVICLWAISDAIRPALPCSPNYLELLKQIDNLSFYNRPESVSLHSLYQILKEKQLLNPKHSLTYISTNKNTLDVLSQHNDTDIPPKTPLLFFIDASKLYQIESPPESSKLLEKTTFFKPNTTSEGLQILPIHLTKQEDILKALSYISPPKRTLIQDYFYSYQGP